MEPMEWINLVVGLISGGAAGGAAVTVPVLQLRTLRREHAMAHEESRRELARLRVEAHEDAKECRGRIDAILARLAASGQR